MGWTVLVGARFSAPVQTDPGAHPASCTMGTALSRGVKWGWGVLLTTHPLLMPLSWKNRIEYPHRACKWDNFTYN
jgi:hypothetical protein